MSKKDAGTAQKKKENPETRTASCSHDVETSPEEMRLVFNCKECPVKADLRNRDCMKGVLTALTANFNADNVVLSDYVELRYSGVSMKMLRDLVELSNEMDNLAMRNPVREYFGNISQSAKDKRRSICNACKANPQTIFPGLKKKLLEDIERFYGDVATASRNIKSIRAAECQNCVRTSEEAMVYIFNLTEEFRAFLYYEGFRVLI